MERNGELIHIKYRDYFFTTLVTTGSTMIANIVDRMMVGKLIGSTSMSAISLTLPIVFLNNLIYGLCFYGGCALAATYSGKRDKEKANLCFTFALTGSMLMWLLVMLPGLIFFEPLANKLCAGNPELLSPVREYLFPLLFIGFFAFWTLGMLAFIRNDGVKELAIVIPIVSNVLNLLFDYIFMKILGTGITGAGWATNIGLALAGFLVIPYLYSKKRTVFFRWPKARDFVIVPEIIQTGLGTAALNGGLMIKQYVMNGLVVTVFGSVGAVVMAICQTANTLSSVFYIGTSQTMLSIGGALYGEKDYNGIRYLFYRSVRMMLCFCIPLTLLLWMFPMEFAAAFGTDTGSMEAMLVPALRLFCASILFVGFQNTLRSHMQSCGYKNEATAMMVLDSTVCFIPICYFFSVFKPELIWTTYTLAPALSMLAAYVYLRLFPGEGRRNDALFLPVVSEESKDTEFSIKSDPGDVEKASESVLMFCHENNIDSRSTNRIWLTIQELCSNIAQYAYGEGGGSADIFLKLTDSTIVLRIRDNGVMFNPVSFVDESGREISGLKLLEAMNINLEYNRVLGFNNTIVTFDVGRSI